MSYGTRNYIRIAFKKTNFLTPDILMQVTGTILTIFHEGHPTIIPSFDVPMEVIGNTKAVTQHI